MIDERSIYWWIGQLGIALEIVGAAWIVFSAYRGLKSQHESYVNTVADPMTDFKSIENPGPAAYDAIVAIIDEFKQISERTYRNELIGFGLFAIGLILQLVGNF